MVGKTNEEALTLRQSRERDDMWELMRSTYPDFARLEVPLDDHIALREAANIIAGAMQRILVLTQGPCPDQHATVAKCYGILKQARAAILKRPPRMRTNDYVYRRDRNANGRFVQIEDEPRVNRRIRQKP